MTPNPALLEKYFPQEFSRNHKSVKHIIIIIITIIVLIINNNSFFYVDKFTKHK